jgi:phosphopantothenoylcysteine synthetase/decarboxylase
MSELFSNEGIVELEFSNTKKIKINFGWIHITLTMKHETRNLTKTGHRYKEPRYNLDISVLFVLYTYSVQLHSCSGISRNLKKMKVHSWQWLGFYSTSDQDEGDGGDDDDDEEEEEKEEEKEEDEEREEGREEE